MRSLIPLFPFLFLVSFLVLTGCDDGEVVDPNDYPLPESGVFTSDTLEYTALLGADTSPGGDVFLLATNFFGMGIAEDWRVGVVRISPYGQTIFHTGTDDFLAAGIHATADYGCVGAGSPSSVKFDADGNLYWQLDVPTTQAIARPDGSVILIGHEDVEDTLIHVTAVNALGMTLWSSGFERDPHEIVSGADLMPDGSIALLLQQLYAPPPGAGGEIDDTSISGVKLISSDGSTQHTMTLEDPGFVYGVRKFIALQDGGFATYGLLDIGGEFPQYRVVAWNASGSIAWEYASPELHFIPEDMEATDDGGLLLLAMEASASPVKLRLFDSAGALQWTREYGQTFPSQAAYPLDVAVLSDNVVQICYHHHDGAVTIVREELN